MLYIRTIRVNRGMSLLDVYYKVYYEYKRRLVGVSD